MKKISLYILCASLALLLIVSCQKKELAGEIQKKLQVGGAVITSKEKDVLTIKKGNSVTYLKYNSNNDLIDVSMLIDSIAYGHKFKFDTEGDLNEYQYLINTGNNYSYSLQRKFMSDTIFEKGTPFVDFFRNKKDSNKISLVFSLFPRKTIDVEVSFNKKHYKKINISGNAIIPLTAEVDIDCGQEKTLFLKISASNLYNRIIGLDDKKDFFDTCVIR